MACLFQISQKRQWLFNKKFIAFFVLLLCSFSIYSAPGYAAPGNHSVGLGAGQILLMGDFAKNFDDGLGFELNYSYEASNLFGVLVNINMNNHSSVKGNTLGIKGLSPNLRINLAFIDRVVMYAFTGFGLFMVNETVGSSSASATTLGFNLGAAAGLQLSPHFMFTTSLGFHNIFGKTDSSTTTASSPGVSVGGTYLGLFLGLMYIF